MNRKVLITGATGDTGRAAVKESIARGLTVRAMVHGRDDRSAALEKQGAEVVVGDLHNIDSIREAMEGIDAAYLVYPVQPGLIDAPSISRRPRGKRASPRSSICPRNQLIEIRKIIYVKRPSSLSRFSIGRVSQSPIFVRPISSNGCSTRFSSLSLLQKEFSACLPAKADMRPSARRTRDA